MPPPGAIRAGYSDHSNYHHIPQSFMNRRPAPASADTNTRPYAIFFSYMAICLALTVYIVVKLFKSYTVLSKSVTARRPPRNHVRLFAFLASGSLLTTWYYMVQFFRTSYRVWAMWRSYYQLSEDHMHWGLWLKETSLFKEAWEVAITANARYFWTHQIFFFACILGLGLEQKGIRRNIRHTWAFMLLGQIVAISFATNLFLLAVLLSPTLSPASSPSTYRQRKIGLWLVNVAAIVATEIPAYLLADQRYWHRPEFLPLLLTPHVALLAPPVARIILSPELFSDLHIKSADAVYTFLWYITVLGGSIVWIKTFSLSVAYGGLRGIGGALFDHPAVSSVGFDVIFCWITWLAWWWTQRKISNEDVMVETANKTEGVGSGTMFSPSDGKNGGVRRR